MVEHVPYDNRKAFLYSANNWIVFGVHLAFTGIFLKSPIQFLVANFNLAYGKKVLRKLFLVKIFSFNQQAYIYCAYVQEKKEK